MIFSKYKRGMVYWCKLPILENNSVLGGNRPVIIVSNDVANAFSPTITVVPCTTNIDKNPDQPTRIQISLNPREDSLIVCEDIITIGKSYFGDFMGMLDEEIMNKVDECIKIALGLTDVPKPKEKEITPEEKKAQQEKAKEEYLENKKKHNRGRKVSGPIEMAEFLQYAENHTKEETMAEYGIPSKMALAQRIMYYRKRV